VDFPALNSKSNGFRKALVGSLPIVGGWQELSVSSAYSCRQKPTCDHDYETQSDTKVFKVSINFKHYFAPAIISLACGKMVSFEYKSVGFIGLGAMGKPMAGHLANKLPANTSIYVFDVVEAAVDELCTEFPNRVVKGANAKAVAEQCVRLHDFPSATT
jgi:hypothetical protein